MNDEVAQDNQIILDVQIIRLQQGDRYRAGLIGTGGLGGGDFDCNGRGIIRE